MIRACDFQNKDAARVAILERVDLDTPKTEKDPRVMVGHDLCISANYPHMKTVAGAIQCSSMPWDCRRRQSWWSVTGLFSAFVAITSK